MNTSAVSKAGTYAVSEDTTHIWMNVTPGEHTFSAQLTDQKRHAAAVAGLPPALRSRLVLPRERRSSRSPIPLTAIACRRGNILIVIEVGGFIVSAADMGVVNREGEGHLIYYIDEDPPTDAGAPAKTDTCAVSTELSHLWKNISQGLHKFAVQLVNNDDTPLDTPVTATITLDIKP